MAVTEEEQRDVCLRTDDAGFSKPLISTLGEHFL